MSQLTLPIYNLSGEAQGTVILDPAVFGVKPNPTLLHQAIVMYQANRRAPIASTKDRSEVRGGGKKPWRQKGTGHARVGSIRSPLWQGGGVTFGPNSERNYTLRMPQKMRQNALKTALSAKVADQNIIIIDNLAALDGKTKTWVAALTRLPNAGNKALIVDNVWNEKAVRSIRNLPTQKYIDVDGLTVYEVVRFPVLIIAREAVDAITNRLAQHTTLAANKKERV